MTVCIAAICRWPYKDNTLGWAIITASDRMITHGITEYEPSQMKFGFLGTRAACMIAGDIAPHSEAMLHTLQSIRNKPEENAETLARTYAAHIREHKTRRAETRYLAPLGLCASTFIANQKTMDPGVVANLVRQLQSIQIDVEAIICGCDDAGAYIYHIDGEGIVSHHHDIGYVAIGTGSPHASSHLMQVRYSNTFLFFPALYAIYWAKRRAEIAPSVGRETDMHLILRDHIEPISPEFRTALEAAYNEEVKRRILFDQETATRLGKQFEEALNRMKAGPEHTTPSNPTH